MTRDELVKLREGVFELFSELEKLGDYDTNAPHVRVMTKAMLQVIDHLLSRMRGPA
jgi:hypothetical protein